MKPQVLEQPAAVATRPRRITIGLPANPGHGERRFPLTPEAVRTLVDEHEFVVLIEEGAGHEIHYSDTAYTSNGASITGRKQTLGADIVIACAPLSTADIAAMRRGATLWTTIEPSNFDRETLQQLTARAITTLSLTSITAPGGHKPVADILDEVDGCAAMAVAAGFLADGVHGKGILLGGVTGIVPCEVIVVGGTTAGVAAALRAAGLGATVRLFDNDPCRLRNALTQLDRRAIGSSLHRKVYLKALQSADIVINTLRDSEAAPATVDATDAALLKKGAIVFDFNTRTPGAFPSLKRVDLSPAVEALPQLTERLCFVNPGSAVPRTSAMALSNAIVPLLAGLESPQERTFVDEARLNPLLASGIVTIAGKIISRDAATATGLKWTDPALFARYS